MPIFDEWIEIKEKRYPARLTAQRLCIQLEEQIYSHLYHTQTGTRLVTVQYDTPTNGMEMETLCRYQSTEIERRGRPGGVAPRTISHDGSIEASPKILERISAVAAAQQYRCDYRQWIDLHKRQNAHQEDAIEVAEKKLLEAARKRNAELHHLAEKLREKISSTDTCLSSAEVIELAQLKEATEAYRKSQTFEG
jgi:hypothetical protein